MKRTGFKKPGKPLNRRRKPLRSKRYVRTQQQEEYHNEHPVCEIDKCNKPAMPTPHHIDPLLDRKDVPENEYSVCWGHHVGDISIHVLGTITFVEMNNLQDDPKWKPIYVRTKERMGEPIE